MFELLYNKIDVKVKIKQTLFHKIKIVVQKQSMILKADQKHFLKV